MNNYELVSGISIILLFSLLVWIYIMSKKRLASISNELKFFKQEKEYYEEAMILFSSDFNVLFANQSARELLSLNENNEKLGVAKKVQLQISSGMREDFLQALERLVEEHLDSFHLENVYLIISGKEKKVNIFIDKSEWNINQTITCIIDETKLEQLSNIKSERDGSIDFLTGLPSQFLALSDINHMVMEYKKKSESFALFLLGIDHFSDIQTTLGLGYSNQILKNMAQYFLTYPEENMKLYRMDANKFVFVVEGLDSEELARKMAKDLIVYAGNIYKDNNDIHLTCSVGVAIYPHHGVNASKLIDNVYVALYKAQDESESNIEIFNTEDHVVHVDEVQMNEEIQAGLKNHEFFLYYQPIFDLSNEDMVGAEALIRWNHPKFGLITADRFLNVAKKTGLILDIGEYVFREAIKQRKVWNDSGLKKFKITINLSLKEMQVEKLIQKLETLFEDNDIDPRDFNLDITEASAMLNLEKTAIAFRQFKNLGLSLSLDHFGASASSLKHLQLLPLSTIKIDRSLIFDLYSNLDHQITVKAMIVLIHNLGFKVVAEGVETSKESALLYDYGCDFAQGYLFAKPLPAKEFEELLN